MKKKAPINSKRRDFLAATASSAVLASFPWIPRAAVAKTTATLAPGATITTLRIYPAIGISRVGGSPQWFLAPEVPGLPPTPEYGFKDGERKIKKQVQRFRIYAFDEQNQVIGEITQDQAKIAWTTHLANTKAAWYGFNNPLDNRERAPGLPTQKRNQYFVSDEEREKMLVIDGGKKQISGVSVNSAGKDEQYAFSGTFWNEEAVGLGQLRTDDKGRLLVVPPDGASNSPTNVGITSFADNDGWHDDWCDGPVTAKVTLADGRELDAESSWVACVGPNFAPEIPPITTLHDVIANLNAEQNWVLPHKGPLSFRKHIYPTFRRAALMQWVTNAANQRLGWLKMGDLSDPAFITRLADPSQDNTAFRKAVLANFRDPEKQGNAAYKNQRLKIPYMLGDGINYDGSPLQWFQFPALQYGYLQAWAQGKFINDFDDDDSENITAIDDIAVQDQPDALTEAALEPCSGGAFHPGVELTYYLRLAPMYARNFDCDAEPFRLAHKDRNTFVQNIGRLLTPAKAFKGKGNVPPPIGYQMAGDLTRWMGLPWQCDAFSCQQVLLQENFPTAVWWPALLPIDVLTENSYKQLMRTDLPSSKRRLFFDTREAWSRDVAGIGYHANASYWDGITNMIQLWERMGFVVKLPGPVDDKRPAGLPKEMFVEVGRADTMEARFNWKPRNGMLPN